MNDRRLWTVDAARGFAALWVVAHHVLVFNEMPLLGSPVDQQIGWLACIIRTLRFGNMGVPVFFVISGFSIHLAQALHPERHFSIRDYAFRRIWRLYPPYLFALVGAAGLAMAAPVLLRHGDIPGWRMPWWYAGGAPWWYGLACLTTQQAQVPSWANWIWAYNVSLWSIGTEAQLYLAYIFLRPLACRWGFDRIALAAAPVGLLWCTAAPAQSTTAIWGPGWFWAFKTCLIGHLFSWCLGAHLADCYAASRNANQPTMPWRAIGMGAAILVAVSLVLPPVEWALDGARAMMVALATAAILWQLITRERQTGWRPGLIGSRFSWAGVRSYSVYLWHAPVLRLITIAYLVFLPRLPGDNFRCFLAFILAAIVSVVVGYVAFDLAERHFLEPPTAWLKQRNKRMVVTATPPAVSQALLSTVIEVVAMPKSVERQRQPEVTGAS
jgi:peptidoglycan/LPS O-acetylase OafA/YrhL